MIVWQYAKSFCRNKPADSKLSSTRTRSTPSPSPCSLNVTSDQKEKTGPSLTPHDARELVVRRLEGRDLKLYTLRLKFRPFWLKYFGYGAFQLDRKRLVKYGSRVRLTEALTMEFIARTTSIPVARVLDVLDYHGTIHLVQEYIDGDVLADVWRKLTTEEQKTSMQQLKGYVDQLRALTPPNPGRVEAIDGGGCIDSRLASGEWGPFDTIESFNVFFYHDTLSKFPEEYPEVQTSLARIEGRQWRTVFAHGDLGPHNILWKNGRIVAVIDWECSGWFPEYWEYTRTYEWAFWKKPSWWEMFHACMDQYPDELEIEKWLSSYYVRI